jgi:cell division protein FtsQ
VTIQPSRSASPAAIAIIGVIVAGLGTWLVVNSAFFDIRDVRVHGARTISEGEILRLASIRDGANLIMLDTGQVASRLLRDPWIREAVVERDLPTTAVIRVVERRPGGWVEGPEGFAVVAGDGTILETASAVPSRLPSLGPWSGSPVVGERVGGFDGPLRITSAMVASLLRQIEAASVEGTEVVLRLRQGGSILYGPPTQVGAKNRAVAAMLEWAAGEGLEIRTLDVRAPAAPSLQPVRGPKISSPISTS